MEVTRNSRRNDEHSLTHADRPSTQSNELTYAKGVTPISGCGLSSANPKPNEGIGESLAAFGKSRGELTHGRTNQEGKAGVAGQ